MSAKQAMNNKLQGSVAAYLRCGGVVNNQIKKSLLLSLRVKKLKSVNIWQSYKQKRDCLMHFFRFQQCVGQARKMHETTTLSFVTLPNIDSHTRPHFTTTLRAAMFESSYLRM